VTIVARVTRTVRLDEAAIRRLERHESDSHAIPGREVRDLGDALLLIDPRDVDPFWNRMVSVRWPDDPVAFDHRLAEALALFGVVARRPHIWPSPDHNRPADLVARLEANGFRDIGGGHVMVLDDPAACAPIRDGELAPGVTLNAIARTADARGTDVDDAAAVLVDAFGAPPRRAGELAVDLRLALDDPRIVLVLAHVDGVAAAVAKATTFDGCSYLSSIGTRPAFRGRGLGGLVTRAAVASASRPDVRFTYLGVFSGNRPAIHLYERLGFASVGESPDLLLE
jgi:ribosomal protein S18 acetylase RimI-like enzyme